MRRLLVSAMVALAALALAAGAGAGSPAVHLDQADEVFTDLNPCTGAETLITWTYRTFVIREAADASGGFHLRGIESGTVTTADGFSGRFTVAFGFNVSSRGEAGSFILSSTLGNGSGERLLVRAVAQLTVANGELRVERELESLSCLGKVT